MYLRLKQTQVHTVPCDHLQNKQLPVLSVTYSFKCECIFTCSYKVSYFATLRSIYRLFFVNDPHL